MNYLREVENNARVVSLRARIIVIGPGNCLLIINRIESSGKTTLVHHFRGKRTKKVNKKYREHPGVNIHSFTTLCLLVLHISSWEREITTKDEETQQKNKRSVTFSIWDFSGKGMIIFVVIHLKR